MKFEGWTKVISLMTGRCGSAWFNSIVNRHPDVLLNTEIMFNPDNMETHDEYTQRMLMFLGTLPVRLDGWVVRQPAKKVGGYTSRIIHVQDKALLRRFISEMNVRVLHIYRSNLIKKGLSMWMADHLMKVRDKTAHHLTDKKTRPGPTAVKPETLWHFVLDGERETAELAEFIASLDAPVFPITYEEMLRDTLGTVNRALDFMGVPPLEKIATEQVKIIDDDLKSALTNYDEIEARFRGTRFEKFLSEDGG
ncbi:MAG: hypothetical protein P9L99_01935 [Candidatus Lernaella stagnicola]|nr:hypothetical protein [Candidatus Lernaella stagnicola]